MSEMKDLLAITELIYRYAEAVDDQRPDKLVTLFADPCEFRVYGGDKGVARAPDDVERMSRRLLSTFTRTSHHVSNIRIVFDGPDRARGLAYLLAWHSFAGGRPDGILWGRYHDVFEKQGGNWLFVERTLRITNEQDFAFKWLPPQSGWLG